MKLLKYKNSLWKPTFVGKKKITLEKVCDVENIEELEESEGIERLINSVLKKEGKFEYENIDKS